MPTLTYHYYYYYVLPPTLHRNRLLCCRRQRERELTPRYRALFLHSFLFIHSLGLPVLFTLLIHPPPSAGQKDIHFLTSAPVLLTHSPPKYPLDNASSTLR